MLELLTCSPFAGHVLSVDTLRLYVDSKNRLVSERLIRKQGRLPWFAKKVLGNIDVTMILETTVVDPSTATLDSWTRNLEHTRILKVDEYIRFKADSLDSPSTTYTNKMVFTCNFGSWSIRDRIEKWCYKQSIDRLKNSHRSMSYIMKNLHDKGLIAYSQMQRNLHYIHTGFE